MRMRGLEPPPGFPDTDLNRARLPIPPHPRASGEAKISHPRRTPRSGRALPPHSVGEKGPSPELSRSTLLASSRP